MYYIGSAIPGVAPWSVWFANVELQQVDESQVCQFLKSYGS